MIKIWIPAQVFPVLRHHWAWMYFLYSPVLQEPPGAGHRELMLQQATQCVSQLIRRAAAQRRNYILDQVAVGCSGVTFEPKHRSLFTEERRVLLTEITWPIKSARSHFFTFVFKANIYQSARRHKMLCFHGYRRRAVVVLPPDEVWRRRLVQRREQEGTALQETSLLKAKGATVVTRSWVSRRIISCTLVKQLCSSLLVFQWASRCRSRESIWIRWCSPSSALTRPWSS